MGARSWAAGLGLVAATAAIGSSSLACTRRPPGCEHRSIERCLWERGVAPPDRGQGEGEGDEGSRPSEGEGGELETPQWTELDAVVGELAELMGAGLEWPLVDARARELCGDEVVVSDAAQGEAWSCSLAQTLEVQGRELLLEVGSGVVSLTTTELSERESAELLELARTTSRDACVERRFSAVDGALHQEFERCTLAAGPLLYIGRFPRDLEADVWQVSIAVVDAG